MQLKLAPAFAFALLLSASNAFGTTIAEAPNLTLVTTLPYFGQSFTVTGSGQFNQIAITFFSTNPDYPRPNDHFANGDGYLFSSIYNGLFSGLPTASENLVGVGHASDGSYYFASDVTLDAGKQYFFYSGGINYSGLAAGDTSYQGGKAYFSGGGDTPFYPNVSLKFRTEGTAVTPEPSSLALLGTGTLFAAGMIRRRVNRTKR